MGNTESTPSSNDQIVTKMSRQEYQQYQQFLAQKNKPPPKVRNPNTTNNTQRPLLNTIKVGTNKIDNVQTQEKNTTVKNVPVPKLPSSKQPASVDNQTFNMPLQRTNHPDPLRPQFDTHFSDSQSEIKNKFAQATNERIYSNPNSTYHPQPRMDMVLQQRQDLSNMKDDYQNIYQQRQCEMNSQYLQTMQQHGQIDRNRVNFEKSVHERETLKHNLSQKSKFNTQETTTDCANKSNDSRGGSESSTRHREYLNQLKHFSLNQDPYKLLGVTRDSNIPTVTKAYRKLAKSVHPDKGGSTEQFNQLTKAYMLILEKQKGREGEGYQGLKEEHQAYVKTQQSGNAPLGEGSQFNQELFNKMYEETRLSEPNDSGYQSWIKDNPYSSTDIEPVFSTKFNQKIFDTTFQTYKDKQTEGNEIIEYTDPQAAFGDSRMGFSTIGEGDIDNFGKHRPLDISKGLEYSDYREALSNTTLINHKHVKQREQYKDLDDIERSRDNTDFTQTQGEIEFFKKRDFEREQQEQLRRDRAEDRDKIISEKWGDWNQLHKKYLGK
jgi:curved DNA-binding protein CbpA